MNYKQIGMTFSNWHTATAFHSSFWTEVTAQTRISRFEHDDASARKQETLILDQYFRFCVPPVEVTAPSQ